MTRDQIDELMRENGIVVTGEAVYALVQLVIKHEREACAKVCDDWPVGRDDVYSIATAIRERRQA